MINPTHRLARVTEFVDEFDRTVWLTEGTPVELYAVELGDRYGTVAADDPRPRQEGRELVACVDRVHALAELTDEEG
jgi:hypothetical protein